MTDHLPLSNMAARSKPGNRKRSAAAAGVGDPSASAPKLGRTSVVLTLREKFSPAAAEFIVNEMRLEDLPEGMFDVDSDYAKIKKTTDKAALLKILKQEVSTWAKGESKVSYRYGKNWAALKMGRLYANNGLQRFPRIIRATLSAAFSDDVDIKMRSRRSSCRRRSRRAGRTLPWRSTCASATRCCST